MVAGYVRPSVRLPVCPTVCLTVLSSPSIHMADADRHTPLHSTPLHFCLCNMVVMRFLGRLGLTSEAQLKKDIKVMNEYVSALPAAQAAQGPDHS